MDNTQQIIPSQPPQVNPNHKSNLFLSIVGLFLFALVIAVFSSAGTIWYLNNHMASQNTQQLLQTVTQPVSNQPTISVKSTPTTSSQSNPELYNACLPRGITLSDSLDNRFGPSGTIGIQLQSLDAQCVKGQLETSNGSHIYFFQSGDCLGVGTVPRYSSGDTPENIPIFLKKYNLPSNLPHCS